MTTSHPPVAANGRLAAIGLESKLPPAALVAIAASLMWFAAQNQASDFTLPASLLCATTSVLAGALICLAGVLSFRRAKTTVNPMKPASVSTLVAWGVYRYSRNPMYLGFLLILLGWALWLSNVLAFVLLPAFVLYMNRFQIRPEERALHSRFGRDYSEYQANVRRWL
ncbi:MAG: isoprenylcysteine carboxylmethyltransferase family protein [Bryobacterales bacterium]|nr:isoprenylcysteine carboxylmethyltransferase family protein [Bryobacterales bacterium]